MKSAKNGSKMNSIKIKLFFPLLVENRSFWIHYLAFIFNIIHIWFCHLHSCGCHLSHSKNEPIFVAINPFYYYLYGAMEFYFSKIWTMMTQNERDRVRKSIMEIQTRYDNLGNYLSCAIWLFSVCFLCVTG